MTDRMFADCCYGTKHQHLPSDACPQDWQPAEVRAARKALGLSANGLAEALRLGKGGGRTVRRWESGETPISGPATVAVELLMRHGVE